MPETAQRKRYVADPSSNSDCEGGGIPHSICKPVKDDNMEVYLASVNVQKGPALARFLR